MGRPRKNKNDISIDEAKSTPFREETFPAHFYRGSPEGGRAKPRSTAPIGTYGGAIASQVDLDRRADELLMQTKYVVRKRRKSDPLDLADCLTYSFSEHLFEQIPGLSAADFSDECGGQIIKDVISKIALAETSYYSLERDRDYNSYAEGAADQYTTFTPSGKALEHVTGAHTGAPKANLFTDGDQDDIDAYKDQLDQFERELRGIYQERKDVLSDGTEQMLRAEHKDTESLMVLMDEFRGSTALKWIKGNSDDISAPIGQQNVLLSWISSPEVRESVLAEALAQLEIYVMAGWAQNDFDPNHPLPEDPAQQKAVITLRAYARMFETEQVSGLNDSQKNELCRALDARFSEIFVPMKLDYRGHGNSPRALLVEENQSLITFDRATGRYQGTGVVDVVAKSANDPNKWYVATVTANKNVHGQRDQHVRHISAIERSMREGLPPFGKKAKIEACLFYSSAIMQERGHRNDLRRNFKNAFNAAGIVWDDQNNRQKVDNVCLLSLFGRLNHVESGISPDPILKTRHLRFGAGSTPFDPSQSISDISVEVARFLSAVTEEIATASPYLRVVQNGKNKSNDLVNTCLINLADALQGLQKHYGFEEHMTDLPAEEKKVRQRVTKTLRGAAQNLKILTQNVIAQHNSGGAIDHLISAINHIGLPDASVLKNVRMGKTKSGNEYWGLSVTNDKEKILELKEQALKLKEREEITLKKIDAICKSDKGESSYKQWSAPLCDAAVRFSEKTVDLLIKTKAHGLLAANQGHLIGENGELIEFRNCYDEKLLQGALKKVASFTPEIKKTNRGNSVNKVR